MSIESAIYTLCISDTTISGLISDKFYPHYVPQDEELPVVVYEVDELENEHLSGSDSATENVRLYINVFCSGYSSNKEIRDAFKLCLRCYTGTSEGVVIQKCFFVKGGAIYSEDRSIYNGFLEFKISYN